MSPTFTIPDLPEAYLRSLTDMTLDEDQRRVLGTSVVIAMAQRGDPRQIVEQAMEVYRDKYPGMFEGYTYDDLPKESDHV